MNQPTEISVLIEAIGQKNKDLKQIYSSYKDEQVKLSEMKRELLVRLSDAGLKSVKSVNYGASIVTKPVISVTSEQSVKEWLNNTPDIESDAYIGLKLTPFKQFATLHMKETGELIDGVDYSAQESLSIRGNK